MAGTLAACGSSSSGGGTSISLPTLPTTPVDTRVGKSGGTFRLSTVESAAIDPYNSQDSEGQLVTKNIFDTLTTVTPEGKIEKQLAASYSSNSACTDWTFNVKPNQKFSNGEAVDAESIKRGMTRAALGSAASAVSYHMANIKGFDALQSSSATDPTKVNFAGVTASGDVLKVALAAPDCEFDLKTAQPVFSPVPVEAGAATNRAYNDDPIGNGPFKMAGPWQHDKSITLVRNTAYTDGPQPLLDKVEITINNGGSPTFEDKNFGTSLDYARVDPSDLASFAKKYYSSDQGKNAFLKVPTYGIEYLIPMVANKPMNSLAAREAVSYAIDRDAIIHGVFDDSQTKATSLVAPAFKGQGTYQPGICASCIKQDPKKAKALAAQAGLPAGSKVNLVYNTGPDEGYIQAIGGELENVLGWKVNLQPEPFKTLLTDENSPKANGLYRSGWFADYPTAWNFLQPLLGTEPANNPGTNSGRYSNKQVDDLLAKGLADPNATSRAADYRAAEKIAIGKDLAVIPLWFSTRYSVFNSKFVGVNIDFFGNPTLRTMGFK